jgi:hypothetical protein
MSWWLKCGQEVHLQLHTHTHTQDCLHPYSPCVAGPLAKVLIRLLARHPGKEKEEVEGRNETLGGAQNSSCCGDEPPASLHLTFNASA